MSQYVRIYWHIPYFLQPWAEPLTLYPFRFRDPLTGIWVRARYVAERNEIAARYAEWEVTGAPEIRARGRAETLPCAAHHDVETYLLLGRKSPAVTGAHN